MTETPEPMSNDWFVAAPFVRYDPATGEIIEYGRQSKAATALFIEQGKPYVMGEGTDVDFVALPEGVIEPKMPFPGSLDGMNLVNLPIPCRVYIGTEIYEVDDGEVELSFGQPGTYPILVQSPCYQDASFEVTL